MIVAEQEFWLSDTDDDTNMIQHPDAASATPALQSSPKSPILLLEVIEPPTSAPAPIFNPEDLSPHVSVGSSSSLDDLHSSFHNGIQRKKVFIKVENESSGILATEVKLLIGPSLTPPQLEAFIRQQIGTDESSKVQLFTSDGFAVPFVWDLLEDQSHYVLKVIELPSPRDEHSRHKSRPLRRCRTEIKKTPAPPASRVKRSFSDANQLLSSGSVTRESDSDGPVNPKRVRATIFSKSGVKQKRVRSSRDPTPEVSESSNHSETSGRSDENSDEGDNESQSSSDSESAHSVSSSEDKHSEDSKEETNGKERGRLRIALKLSDESDDTSSQSNVNSSKFIETRKAEIKNEIRNSVQWIFPYQHSRIDISPSAIHPSNIDLPSIEPSHSQKEKNNNSETPAIPSSPKLNGHASVPETSVPSVSPPGEDVDVMRIYHRVKWLTLGISHPEALAESESLASVTLPPVSPSLQLRIPMEVAEKGLLSNPQLECSIYAARTFNQALASGRVHGYFLGDGTGCGKGRIIASCIWHLWNLGHRRHVWVSVGADLVQDAMRDLKDVGAGHIPVVDLGHLKLVDLDSKAGFNEAASRAAKLNSMWSWSGEGVLFSTYSLLARSVNQKDREEVLMGPNYEGFSGPQQGIFGKQEEFIDLDLDEDSGPPIDPSPECVNMSVRTRLGQMLKWMSKAPDPRHKTSNSRLLQYLRRHPNEAWKEPYWTFRPEKIKPGGLLCFDEAHKAKNLVSSTVDDPSKKGTSSGQTVQKLQNLLKHCPVLYASATGATELRNMAYMSRLGLWGPGAAFDNFLTFKDAVERGGVAAMECLAMDLKSAGLYSCRTLSFSSVTFHPHIVASSAEFVTCYDATARLMTKIYALMLRATESCKSPTFIKAQFWSTQQRVFKQLLVSQKIEKAVELAKEAVKKGRQVVISLWGTGEARTADKIKELTETKNRKKGSKISEVDEDSLELDDFLSPPKLMLDRLIREKLASSDLLIPKQQIETLLAMLEEIDFPNNPLDDLIDKLGGPNRVAELSGRSKRLVWDSQCRKLTYKNRDVGEVDARKLQSLADRGLASVNIKEQELFQSSKKKFAVITEAASAGISLHSDNQRLNSAAREMICIELPWAADKAVQQFGRIHRSNQRFPPTYQMLVSDVGGERRFVACIAKRMKTLGAITRGDRRAAFGGGEGRVKEVDQQISGTDSVKLTARGDDETCLTPAPGVIPKSSNDHQVEPSSPGGIADDDIVGGMPLLDLDIYSKWGTQARQMLFRWLAKYGGDMEASRHLELNISPPTCVAGVHAINPRYKSNEEFALSMLALLRACGVLEQGDSGTRKDDKSKGKDMDRFLNRILMLPLAPQNNLFNFFNQIHDEIVDAAKSNREFDRGVEHLNVAFGTPYKISILSKEVLWCHPRSGSQTLHYHLCMDRGISWQASQKLLSQSHSRDSTGVDGYYWAPFGHHSGKRCAALVLRRKQFFAGPQRLLIYKPHMGVSPVVGIHTATVDAIRQQKWVKVLESEAEKLEREWTLQYENSTTNCIHQQVWGNCKNKDKCRIGKRLQSEHLLTGNIVTLWGRLEHWFQTSDVDENEDVQGQAALHAGTRKPLRLIRATVATGPSLVGAKLPHDRIEMIRRNLKAFHQAESSSQQELKQHEALHSLYKMSKYLKFMKLIVSLLPNKDGPGMLLEDLWTATMDFVDNCRMNGSSEWNEEDLTIVVRAFPPVSMGMQLFDKCLQPAVAEHILFQQSALYFCNPVNFEDFIRMRKYSKSGFITTIARQEEVAQQNIDRLRNPNDYATRRFEAQKGDFMPLNGPWAELPPPPLSSIDRRVPEINLSDSSDEKVLKRPKLDIDSWPLPDRSKLAMSCPPSAPFVSRPPNGSNGDVNDFLSFFNNDAPVPEKLWSRPAESVWAASTGSFPPLEDASLEIQGFVRNALNDSMKKKEMQKRGEVERILEAFTSNDQHVGNNASLKEFLSPGESPLVDLDSDQEVVELD